MHNSKKLGFNKLAYKGCSCLWNLQAAFIGYCQLRYKDMIVLGLRIVNLLIIKKRGPIAGRCNVEVVVVFIFR
jgi:hypothetical protein